ncbi:MAG: tetratricopeptide repeat protein [candidate division Zixibacteria bacterium]|nr:tetratricopeptide repeat protein [candidate division Zixibacteria bacterium]
MKTKLFAAIIAILSISLFVVSCADKNLRQGKILMQNEYQDYERAIEQFEMSLEKNPENVEAWLLKGEAHGELEQWRKMDESFDKVVELDPSYKQEIDKYREQKWKKIFDRGNAENDKKNFNAALEKFETAMIIDDNKFESYYNAAIAANQLELDKKAYEYAKTAYEMNPESASNAKLFAEICYKQGRFDEAVTAFKEARELDEQTTYIDLRLARIYENEEDYENASKHYELALDSAPDNADIWFNLGVMYLQKLEDLPKADNAFARATQYNPEDVDAAFNRILVLSRMEKFDEAIEVLEKLEQQDPENCDIYDLGASIHQELGNKGKVNEYIRKGRECSE